MVSRLACICLAGSLLGCGDDGSPQVAPDADHGLSEFAISNTDDSGIAHSFTIHCADLLSELPLTFTTDGAHAHSLSLSSAELQMILAGQTVEARFTDGHEHFFSITKPIDACTGY
jgi:hypothetical protein